MTPRRRLALSTLASGALSYLGTWLLDLLPGGTAVFRNSGVYLPGVLFGAMVMAPRAPSAPRRAGAVALSTLIYYAAVKLAMHLAVSVRIQEMLACGLSGLLGAIAVAAAARLVLRWKVPPARLAEAALAGACTGVIFGLKGTFALPGSWEAATLVIGFVSWQTGVGLALFGRD
jgi:hypothetical protein